MRAFLQLVRRDLHLSLRQGGDSAMVLVFFVLAVVLFPFGVGPEPNILARIGPGVIWVTALLASMLSLDMMFRADYEDGNLEQLLLGPVPVEALVAAKCIGHWLVTGFPLVLMAPILALMMNMHADGFPVLIAAMALGTPVLTLIGAVGAALTLGARRGGVLVALLVLPLYVPVLIFGVGAIDAATAGLTARPHLLIMGGLLLFSMVIGPWAAGAAARHALT